MIKSVSNRLGFSLRIYNKNDELDFRLQNLPVVLKGQPLFLCVLLSVYSCYVSRVLHLIQPNLCIDLSESRWIPVYICTYSGKFSAIHLSVFSPSHVSLPSWSPQKGPFLFAHITFAPKIWGEGARVKEVLQWCTDCETQTGFAEDYDQTRSHDCHHGNS